MKKVFQNKKYSEKCDIAKHFATSFNALLNRRHGFSILLLYAVCCIYCLFEVYKENPAIHRYIVEKGCMEYFSVFSWNCDRFLKICWNVNFETISMKFLCSVTLKMYWIFDVYVTITLDIGHLKKEWFTELCRSFKCRLICLYNI